MAIREEEEVKRIQIRKEEAKLSLLADDLILYMGNPRDATRKLLELVNELIKLQDTKLKDRNLLRFYTLTIKNKKKKNFRKQSHLPLHQKE